MTIETPTTLVADRPRNGADVCPDCRTIVLPDRMPHPTTQQQQCRPFQAFDGNIMAPEPTFTIAGVQTAERT